MAKPSGTNVSLSKWGCIKIRQPLNMVTLQTAMPKFRQITRPLPAYLVAFWKERSRQNGEVIPGTTLEPNRVVTSSRSVAWGAVIWGHPCDRGLGPVSMIIIK